MKCLTALTIFTSLHLSQGVSLLTFGKASLRENSRVQTDTYIYGGELVTGRDFPSLISLRVNGSHHCGGSILTSDWILTTAFCAEFDVSKYKVVEGSNLLDEGGRQHEVVEIRRHVNFSREHGWDDIAVLKVNPPIVLDDGVDTVKLPRKGQSTPVGSKAVTAGWGYTEYGQVLSNKLLKVDVTVSDKEQCNYAYSTIHFEIKDTQICAGIEAGGKGVCIGDYGGPLFVNGEAVGIASNSKLCAVQGFPDIYTEIADYIDWIDEHITL